MKKLFALFVTTLVLAALCGCGGSNSANSDVGLSVIPAFDKHVSWGAESYNYTERYGFYQAVSDGWIALGGYNYGPAIVKFDEQGSKIWETSLGDHVGDTYYDWQSFVIEAPDGYIVGNGYYFSFTVKCDKDGNVVWVKDLGIGVAIGNGAGFVGVGGGKTPYISTIFIAQYDFDGNVVWEKPLGDDLKLFQYALAIDISKILIVPNGYFLVGGWSTVGLDLPPHDAWDGLDLIPDPGDYQDFIASVGVDGTFRWQKTMQMNVGDVAVLKDGIVALGQIYDDNYRSVPIVEKYDFELKSIWRRSYEKYDRVGDGFNSVAVVGDDIFVSGGTVWGYWAVLLGIDSTNGKLLWEDSFPGKYTDEYGNQCQIEHSRIFASNQYLSLLEFDYHYGDTVLDNYMKIYLRQYGLYD